MKRTKIFFINGIILTLTALIMRSIGMLFGLYVSNKIGSEAVGTFSLVMSVYMFFVIIATSGLSLACTCIVSEQFAKGNFFDGLKAVKSCLLFSLFIGLGSLIGINICLPLGMTTLSGLSLAGVVGISLNAILTRFNK